MRRNQWQYLFSAGISLAFLSVATYADDTTTAQAATEARHQPVVAPVPSGTSPSDPGVSSASPSDDVNVSTPPTVSTKTF